MSQIDYSVANDFSVTPGPRRRSEGRHSGEELLDLLRPLVEQALSEDRQLLVDLDGTAGYATSFLEAVFGGLAREFGAEEVISHLEIRTDEEPYLEDEVYRYIREAGKSK